jgi:hypothetical protein
MYFDQQGYLEHDATITSLDLQLFPGRKQWRLKTKTFGCAFLRRTIRVHKSLYKKGQSTLERTYNIQYLAALLELAATWLKVFMELGAIWGAYER